MRFSLVLIFCFLEQFSAMSQKATFRHLTINDGLSQNMVFVIHQDRKGFMWFGTKDGLNRYDGYTFKVFHHDPIDTTSLSSSFITSILEDKHGWLWIGTEKNGINLFDPKTEKFRRIPLLPAFAGMTEMREIRTIAEDKEGNIWVGTTGDGLFKISVKGPGRKQYVYKQYLHDPSDSQSLCNNVISAMYFDEDGFLWLGTEKGLNRMDPEAEIFSHFLIDSKNPLAPDSEYQYTIAAIAPGKDGNLWLGKLEGLIDFNKKTQKFVKYPHQFDVFRYGWGNIKGIAKDKRGNLWLSTSAMLMKFDTDLKTYYYYKNDPFDPESLIFNGISSVFIDRQGIIWVGTSGLGISKLDPKSNRFPSLKYTNRADSRVSGFSVKAILEENKDVLWIGGEVLYRWNRKENTIKSFETSSNRPDDFGNTVAWSMIKSTKGKLWFATHEGLYRYDPKSGKTEQIKTGNQSNLPQKSVFAVYEDKQNDIWIMTENYICKLIDFDSGTFDCFKYNAKPSYSEHVRPVIYQDDDRIFWIGTKDGLLRFDDSKGTFKNYQIDPSNPNSIINNYIKSICPDPKNPKTHLWIGTSGGLSYFNKTNDSFINFTEKNNLPNNVVYGILSYKKDQLWISTNKGLSIFTPATQSFRNFDVRDGLQSNEFNTGAYHLASDGEMFFGGISGLNYFYPDKITDHLDKPPVIITSIVANSEELHPSTHPQLIDKSVFNLDTLKLSYKHDILEFRFSALDYSVPEKNQYSYMLENHSNKWINNGNNNSATFINLPPGKYIFRVKGSNSDGVWNEEGIVLYLIITPPLWATWWAIAGYAILMLGIVLWVRRHELSRIKTESQLALEQVELSSLKELDNLKSKFFANISHEFRTPLTLILGKLDMLIEKETSKDSIEKLKSVDHNAKRLLGLINQLLDLSKIEANSMQVRFENGDIVLFLKNLFYSFESMAEDKSITMCFHSNRDFIDASFDKEKLETILVNLISNAIKFTTPGGKVNLSMQCKDSNLMEIILEDSGIGISENELENIFNRFYQVDSSLARKYEGSGIGLALTKELVSILGGEISATSVLGEGTRFVIKLPIENQHYEKSQALVINSSNADISNNINKQLKEAKKVILLVEDNNDVRTFIKSQLINAYHVIEAADGELGFEIAKNVIPDLIITDVMMPVMDGYEFTNKIRNEEKTGHIPIIMLTAKAGFDDKLAGLETGIDDYLVKPFKAKELIVRINNLIEQRKRLRKRFSTATIIKPSEVSVVSVDQQFIEKVIAEIEKNIQDENLTVDQIAEQLFMSVSQLNKKLNALIDQPGGKLIRSIRLQRAADLLEQNAGNISEICYITGFTDQAYFSRAFKKHFGCSPTKYKEQKRNHPARKTE